MTNSELADNWRTTGGSVCFKVRCFPPVRQFRQSLIGLATGSGGTDPAWNLLAGDRIAPAKPSSVPSSVPQLIDIRLPRSQPRSTARLGYHQPRHLREHLATHDVPLEYYQWVTSVHRNAGSIGVTSAAVCALEPLAKPRPLAQLSRGSTPFSQKDPPWGKSGRPPGYLRARSLYGGQSSTFVNIADVDD